MAEHISRLLLYENGIPDVAAVAARLGRSLATDPDIVVVTDERSIKIAQIRELHQVVSVTPLTKQGHLVIISPAHMLTTPAQQALLKLLEEPPPATQIILTATNRQALLPTILSRCLVEGVGGAEETVAGETTPSLIEQLVTLTTTQEKVTFIQNLPSKREELLPLLENELRRSVNYTAETWHWRQGLVETLAALRSNVNPQLCLEHWILG